MATLEKINEIIQRYLPKIWYPLLARYLVYNALITLFIFVLQSADYRVLWIREIIFTEQVPPYGDEEVPSKYNKGLSNWQFAQNTHTHAHTNRVAHFQGNRDDASWRLSLLLRRSHCNGTSFITWRKTSWETAYDGVSRKMRGYLRFPWRPPQGWWAGTVGWCTRILHMAAWCSFLGRWQRRNTEHFTVTLNTYCECCSNGGTRESRG